MAFCGKCGEQINDGVGFCPKCGNAMNSAPAQQPVQQAMPNQTAGVAGAPVQGDGKLTLGESLLSDIWPIGFIMYFTKKDTFPIKAKACLRNAIISLVICTVVMIIFGF